MANAGKAPDLFPDLQRIDWPAIRRQLDGKATTVGVPRIVSPGAPLPQWAMEMLELELFTEPCPQPCGGSGVHCSCCESNGTLFIYGDDNGNYWLARPAGADAADLVWITNCREDVAEAVEGLA